MPVTVPQKLRYMLEENELRALFLCIVVNQAQGLEGLSRITALGVRVLADQQQELEIMSSTLQAHLSMVFNYFCDYFLVCL
jgi:hypothetical protein